MKKVVKLWHWTVTLTIFSILIMLVMAPCRAEHVAAKPSKIVGLLQVRNEELYIEQCLRVLAYYTDAIVVLDDDSQDKTLDILKSLMRKLHIEKIIHNRGSAWQKSDERFNRQTLLDAGRSVGGTHFIFIDADEMFSAQCRKDDWLRKVILSMKKGQLLRIPEINLWGSVDYYRDDELFSPVTTSWKQKPFALCDDGMCNYNDNKSWSLSGAIHCSVDPVNRKVEGKVPRNVYYTDINKSALHFKFVNLDNVETKRVWYMCLEFIRMNQKPSRINNHQRDARNLNNFYSTVEYIGIRPKERAAVKVTPCPKKWFAYPYFDKSIYYLHNSDKQKEVLAWFKHYSANYFAPLDIWHLGWVKAARGIQRTSFSTPAV